MEIDNLDKLNDILRTRILCIESDLIRMRRGLASYKKFIEKQQDKESQVEKNNE